MAGRKQMMNGQQPKKTRWRIWLTLVLAVICLSYTAYVNNADGLHDQVIRVTQARQVNRQKSDQTIYSDQQRDNLSKLIMNNHSNGLIKQGFVSIPNLMILLPIYNDAYSKKGLDLGADYANRTFSDPQGKITPVMGQGNYGLAAHNFNDGKTGFSSLQEKINQDTPYLVKGKLGNSNWLNRVKIYLANGSKIYTYKITSQICVTENDVNVLDVTAKQDPKLTIISCLFPSTQYRIITETKLVKTNTWHNAPNSEINALDLTKQPTNAHTSWFNPGTEEGAQGFGSK